MNNDKKAANAVAGKTARACDSCVCKRARWYCAADDAFLCQACDASVHSANSLARRHERVRLKTASMKPTINNNNNNNTHKNNLLEINSSLPTWHQGFRRKARTPRHGKPMMSQQQSPKAEEPIDHLLMMNNNPNNLPLVPEIGCDETSPDENEEELLYRVPIFDPFVEEFCTSVISNEVVATPTNNEVGINIGNNSSKILLPEYEHVVAEDFENLSGLNLPSDLDLTEFTADVEILLGRGLDEDSFGMEELGLMASKEDKYCCFGSNGKVKEEEDDEELEAVVACNMDQEFDISRETLDLNFDYDSPTTGEEEEETKIVNTTSTHPIMVSNDGVRNKVVETTKSISLRLNYEAVITAWASQGSPWTTGDRPPFNPDDCLPDYLGTCHNTDAHHHRYRDLRGGGGGHVGMDGGDGGREARVSRYREKRRTRLFSKKIRYEVRKLNAEKRPRMKGRFVKRTNSSSFMGTSTSTGLPF